jgi:hypothetical protein
MSLRRCNQVLLRQFSLAIRSAWAEQLQEQQLRTVSSTSFLLSSSLQQSPEDNLFVGAYTPVTRQLWQDRLRLAQLQPATAAGATAAKQDADAPRPPKQTVIRYPFTTDRVLLELVSVSSQRVVQLLELMVCQQYNTYKYKFRHSCTRTIWCASSTGPPGSHCQSLFVAVLPHTPSNSYSSGRCLSSMGQLPDAQHA